MITNSLFQEKDLFEGENTNDGSTGFFDFEIREESGTLAYSTSLFVSEEGGGSSPNDTEFQW